MPLFQSMPVFEALETACLFLKVSGVSAGFGVRFFTIFLAPSTVASPPAFTKFSVGQKI